MSWPRRTLSQEMQEDLERSVYWVVENPLTELGRFMEGKKPIDAELALREVKLVLEILNRVADSIRLEIKDADLDAS